jgi:hypothetical protein
MVVSYIVDFMGVVGEQNVSNHMGVRINPPAQLQLATSVRRFKILKMRWVWYGYIPSVFNVRQTLRVVVSTVGLNNGANSESEISYCVRIHWSDLQRLPSMEQLKCIRWVLGGRTHVTLAHLLALP